MISLEDDWEFNVLGIYNYRRPGPLGHYFDFVSRNHVHMEGDIAEAGVFRGRSLLGMALMLRELGSGKKVYGYDTFEGFPAVHHENDDLRMFEALLAKGRISEEHFAKVQRNLRFRSIEVRGELTSKNISLSGDFSRNNVESIRARAEILELDNFELVEGPFEDTMIDARGPRRLMAALLDCDLYESYRVALPFLWSRLEECGYLYLDEYYSLKFPGARIATDEFFSDRPEQPECHEVEAGDFERWFVRKGSARHPG